MGLINKEQEYQDQEAWSNDVQKLKGYKELIEKVEYWRKQKNRDNAFVIQGPCKTVYDNELGWCVDVNGDVDFFDLDIKDIPFQFRNVSGSFWARFCRNLTSLKGCPVYVGGSFICNYCNKITSLKYCPKEVGGNFGCYNCGKEFTKDYIRSLCNINIKGVIYN